jgi:hypothetical protein
MNIILRAVLLLYHERCGRSTRHALPGFLDLPQTFHAFRG